MAVNRIVTRGFGASSGSPGRAGPVTLGYGGPPSFVVEAIEEFTRVRHGGSKRRHSDDLETVIVWARLVEVNDRVPEKKIEGSVRVPMPRSRARVVVERVATGVRDAWRDVKVTIERVRR